MADSIYPIRFDKDTGRAYVEAEGDIDAIKIRNTYIAIRINQGWQKGDHSILWRLEASSFPASFKFGDIIHTTQLARAVSIPCKSAIVLNEMSKMLIKAANFYRIVASDKADRRIEVFFNPHDALAWLDG